MGKCDDPVVIADQAQGPAGEWANTGTDKTPLAGPLAVVE
jgi:hypothetical protein